MVNKYYNKNGDVAVLISSGWGAGWSTWNSEYVEEMIFDKDIVEIIMSNPPEYTNVHGHRYLTEETLDKIEALAKEKYPGAYLGGLHDHFEIEWLAPGTPFYIEEFDGSENIKTAENLIYCA